MDHWQSHFVNRPLTRSLFLSVRWARMAELWASYSVRQAFSRARFLRLIELTLIALTSNSDYATRHWPMPLYRCFLRSCSAFL